MFLRIITDRASGQTFWHCLTCLKGFARRTQGAGDVNAGWSKRLTCPKCGADPLYATERSERIQS
jgi:hypothetical protein